MSSRPVIEEEVEDDLVSPSHERLYSSSPYSHNSHHSSKSQQQQQHVLQHQMRQLGPEDQHVPPQQPWYKSYKQKTQKRVFTTINTIDIDLTQPESAADASAAGRRGGRGCAGFPYYHSASQQQSLSFQSAKVLMEQTEEQHEWMEI
jgi:hypothetical protein